MSKPAYSLVIATYERQGPLADTLASLVKQTHPPSRVIIIDASKDTKTQDLAAAFAKKLPITYERAIEPSAAAQRNQGALHVTTPLVGFLDDDTTLSPDVFEKICAAFERDTNGDTGGIAARIVGFQHKPPQGLLRLYYQLQAGYAHPTYGGKLFGPAINCLPSYTEAEGDLIPSDWLNSTCVAYRTPLFQREKFPDFRGYSYMEDVHLSSRIGRTHKLFFHSTAMFEHHDAPSSFKRDVQMITRMRLRNQRLIANDIMHFSGPLFEAKFFLHKLFSTVNILRTRDKSCWQAILGTWS